jgi:hypothetical protein
MGNSEQSALRREQLTKKYPGLQSSHFVLTSPADHTYNCFAFAAGETWRCWDPSDFGGLYWPPNVPRENSTAAWIAAYESLGYVRTHSVELEVGYEKVAIYARDGNPLHAARQITTGKWVSKLGAREDIEHDLHGLVGDIYGVVAAILERPIGDQTMLEL